MIFLNRFFFPDHSATSQLLSDLAFALADVGRPVMIITSRQCYDSPGSRLAAREAVDGVDIVRVWSSSFGRGNLLGRAIDYLTFYLSAMWRLWQVVRPGDIVVAKTDPPLLSIPTEAVVRLRRAKLVNWMQDIYPDVAVELGMGQKMALRTAFRWLRRLRDRSLQRSACTVAIGERMAQRLSSFKVHPDRIRVISNWSDGDLIWPIPAEDNPLRTEWGFDGAMVIGYSGNLGRAHDYRAILDAIERLERDDACDAGRSGSTIRWLFIGGGTQYERFREVVRARGFSSVRFQPYQPRDRLAQSLSVPDVHIVTLRPQLEGLIVPSKFYGVAAAGRPTIFIGDKDGEIARQLNQHGCGIVVAEGDGAELFRRLRELAANPDLMIQMGGRARSTFDNFYGRAIGVRRWVDLLDEVERRS